MTAGTPIVGGGTGGGGTTTPPTQPIVPTAANVATTTLEGSAVTVTVAQDPTMIVNLLSAGALGMAVLSGPATALYTPNVNASGTDTFAFTLTDPTSHLTSNTATVTVVITPVNNPPVAFADSINGLANTANTFNLLANDSDPDGATDLADAVINSVDSRLGPYSVTGGSITFTPPASSAGLTLSIVYQAKDRAGAVSAAVTSTVRLSASESIQPAKWHTRSARDGGSSPAR